MILFYADDMLTPVAPTSTYTVQVLLNDPVKPELINTDNHINNNEGAHTDMEEESYCNDDSDISLELLDDSSSLFSDRKDDSSYYELATDMEWVNRFEVDYNKTEDNTAINGGCEMPLNNGNHGANHNSLLIKLQDKFNIRRRRIRKMTKDLNLLYRQNMMGIENEMEVELLSRFDNHQILKQSTTPLKKQILFETCYSLPGFLNLVVYGIAHLSIYNIFNELYSSSIEILESDTLAQIASIVIGFLITRFCGATSFWLSDDVYDCIKFDFQSKNFLKHWDAKLQRFWNDHQIIAEWLEMLGFYMVYATLAIAIHQRIFPQFCDISEDLYEGLPSYDSHYYSLVKVKFMERIGFVMSDNWTKKPMGLIGWPSIACDHHLQCCWTHFDELLEADHDYIEDTASKVSYYDFLGDENAPLYSTSCYLKFYITVAFLSTAWVRQIGLNIWRD